MCFEQPERERSALAALGAAVTLEDRGHQRFERTAARWRELVARACVEPSAGRSAAAWSPAAASPSRLTAAARRTGRLSLRRRWSCPRLRWHAAARRSGARSPRSCAPGRPARGSWPASTARLAGLRDAAAAAARSAPDRAPHGRRRDGARALRGGGRARGRADRRRAPREDRARARGRRPRAGAPRRGGRLRRPARGLRRLLRLRGRSRRRHLHRRHARAADAPRGPARSAPSRSPARSAAAPTRRSTTTSASGCCARTRSARSTRSWRGGSSARCARTPSG